MCKTGYMTKSRFTLKALAIALVATAMVASPAQAGDPGKGNLVRRATQALNASTSPTWRVYIPTRVTGPISGYSTLSYYGEIRVSYYHANLEWNRLRFVMSHEFGHQIALKYGGQTYLGQPPRGFPWSGNNAERWADCVAQVWTGMTTQAANGVGCPQVTRDWTRAWLAKGPAAYKPTR